MIAIRYDHLTVQTSHREGADVPGLRALKSSAARVTARSPHTGEPGRWPLPKDTGG